MDPALNQQAAQRDRGVRVVADDLQRPADQVQVGAPAVVGLDHQPVAVTRLDLEGRRAVTAVST